MGICSSNSSNTSGRSAIDNSNELKAATSSATNAGTAFSAAAGGQAATAQKQIKKMHSGTVGFALGAAIEAKVGRWKKYYPGKIANVNENGTYDLVFDDGDKRQGVPDSCIRKRTVTMPVIPFAGLYSFIKVRVLPRKKKGFGNTQERCVPL